MPQEQPQQNCPGMRCKTGKQCIPTKRQCDKYVDCMEAEDELHCDYGGSQYQPNLYRSRNTDHSNLKYGKLKNAQDLSANGTITQSVQLTTVFQNVSSLSSNTTVDDINIIETPVTVLQEEKMKKKNMGLNETILNVIRHLIDNQLTEKTFSCKR